MSGGGGASSAPQAGQQLLMSTTIMGLFFGTCLLLCCYFLALRYMRSEPLVISSKKSEAFRGTASCYASLTTELSKTGLILAFTYICERHWFFEHSQKEYNRDLFIFVLILFFGYALYTIKPTHDLALLGREQTEEWKGWMQFIFLLYHYFHAEEVYNAVRVMITCYVWMTGFGNFSFFFIKQDFGWLRFIQMIWRLNFAVILLMMTHGNTYILYYICPLHTFYFCLVYVTMWIYGSINQTKWAIRFKLLALALAIFLVWDYNNGTFEFLFSWLGTEPVIGAKSGTVWEWYFRTSLDKWSTFFGMIFALNFPLAEQYFVKAKGWPLYFAATILGAAAIWWYRNIYSLEKLEYNLHHNYFAFIPLLVYIFFRNLTPGIRSNVSMSLHDLGKTTLETYLLQHHIWLTSNAKTLLTIVPDHPWVTFALATAMFFAVAKELYRLTMSLRGMVLPDDQPLAKKNLLGAIAVFFVFSAIGAGLYHLQLNSPFGIMISCAVLFGITLLFIGHIGIPSEPLFNQYKFKGIVLTFAAVIAFGMLSFVTSAFNEATTASNGLPSGVPMGVNRINKAECLGKIGDGEWSYPENCDSSASSAYCHNSIWTWHDPKPAECASPFHRYNKKATVSLFQGRNVHFCGDSMARYLYHTFNAHLNSSYDPLSYATPSNKHGDMRYRHETSASGSAIDVEFLWRPRVYNITSCFPSNKSGKDKDVYIVSVMLWDVLYGQNLDEYVLALNSRIPQIAMNRTVIWVQPNKIVDALLKTPEKGAYMSESIVRQYRNAVSSSAAVRNAVSVLIDPWNVSAPRPWSTSDGVHYDIDVNGATMQLVYNAINVVAPGPSTSSGASGGKKPSGPVAKPPEGMSFPSYGIAMIVTAAIMLFTMDSFFGVGFLSLLISGNSYDYDEAYAPFVRKRPAQPPAAEPTTTTAPTTNDLESSSAASVTDLEADVEERKSLLAMEVTRDVDK